MNCLRRAGSFTRARSGLRGLVRQQPRVGFGVRQLLDARLSSRGDDDDDDDDDDETAARLRETVAELARRRKRLLLGTPHRSRRLRPTARRAAACRSREPQQAEGGTLWEDHSILRAPDAIPKS